MKKLVFVGLFAVLASTLCFAAKGTTGGNGNGGADKIGAYVGWPFGLSYSHEFNDLVEIDLLVGYTGLLWWHRLDFQLGALFTVLDPVLSSLGNQKCPLSLGPVVGGNIFFSNLLGYSYTSGGFSLLLPLRWEMNFGNIPDFNVFFELAPVGLGVTFTEEEIRNSSGKVEYKTKPLVHYTARGGVGLRYRIPSKK